MKKIDIIGCFSNADKCEQKKPPVLYQMLASVFEYKKDYEIGNIYLIYGIDKLPENYENEGRYFEENYNIIIRELKERYPNNDFLKRQQDINLKGEQDINFIEKIDSENYKNKKTVNVCFPKYPKENEGLSIEFYLEYYKELLSIIDKENAMYFNLQSGNIQSREALQILYDSLSNKEKYFFNLSDKNTSKDAHTNSKDGLDYSVHEELQDIFKSEDLNTTISRVNLKEDWNEVSAKFHKDIIQIFLNSERYFEAYRHFLTYSNCIEHNRVESLFNKCFSENYNLEFTNHKVTKKEVSEFFLYRLIYLTSVIENLEVETKGALYVANNLLYTLFHLENDSDYIEKRENEYVITKFKNRKLYEVNLGRYSRDTNLKLEKTDKISNIRGICLENFKTNYDKKRHTVEEVKSVLKELIYDLKEKFKIEYCIKEGDFKGSNFEESKDKVIKIIRSNLKPKANFKEDYFDKKVCILSMAGSTDPCNFKSKNSSISTPGSTLSFLRSINKDNQIIKAEDNTSKVLNKLISKRKQKEIPFYFIMSYESIKVLLKDGELTLDMLKEIYKNKDLHILPFAKANDEPFNIKEIIERDIVLDKEKLVSTTSYGEDDEKYSIERCSNFIIDVVNELLDKYDGIYIVESSGLPNCKMALSFMALSYPERIKVISVKRPNGNTTNINNKDNINYFEEWKIFNINKPIDNKDVIYSKIRKNNEQSTETILYLLQMKYHLENIDADTKKIIKKHDKKLDSNEQKIARILASTHYMIEYNLNQSAILTLDSCLELILSINLEKQGFNCKGESLIIRNEYLKKLYYDIIQKPNYNPDYSKYYNTKEDKDIPSDRIFGVVRAVKYIVKSQNENDEFIKSLERINKIWVQVSAQKHKKEDIDKDFILTENDIKAILKFDCKNTIKDYYDKEIKYYEDIKKRLKNRRSS